MKKIRLTQGKYTLVDDDDYEYLNQWNWFYNNRGYVSRKQYGGKYGRKGIHILMHRLILNPPDKSIVDHINMDKLDNRKSNLRIATKAQNYYNQPKIKFNRFGELTSLYKGVYRRKDFTKQGVSCWRARLSCNGKTYYLGTFHNERHAAMAYDIAARDLYGEFAQLNFKALDNP